MRKLLLLTLFIYIVLFLLTLVSCNSKIQTNDSRQDVVQSGESYAYVIVRLEFISDLKQLCQDSLLASNYESVELYNQAVAECTFEKLTILNVNPTQIGTFISTYCQPTSDLSALTPQEVLNINAACSALGVPRI